MVNITADVSEFLRKQKSLGTFDQFSALPFFQDICLAQLKQNMKQTKNEDVRIVFPFRQRGKTIGKCVPSGSHAT